MTESRIALIVAIATLIVNTWMAIQNRGTRKRGKHRKRKR